MFKKSNRNFRTKKASTDEESDDNQGSPTKSKVAAAAAVAATADLANFDKSNKQLIESIRNKKTLEAKLTSTILSFEADLLDEEENEITEFKVKKSKESRRIAKEMKKSKKEKERQAKIDSGHVFKAQEVKEPEKELTSEDVLFAEGIKVKPLAIKKPHEDLKKRPKFLVNRYQGSDGDLHDLEEYRRSDDESGDEEHRRLEVLRKDMEVLNGEEEEEELDEAKKSMKIMLKSGIIPDATMIHEARKKREMARQDDGFIAVDSARAKNRNKNKSRIVREDDDEDGSDDEAVVSLNYKAQATNERQRDRDAFLAYEHGSDEETENRVEDKNIKYRGTDSMSEEDDENEEERWEKEQIRKGVQISQPLPSKLGFETNSRESSVKLMQHILGANVEELEMEIEPSINDLEMLNHLPEVSFVSIKDILNKNLELLREKLRTQTNEHTHSVELLKANQTDYDHLKTIRPSLDKQYVYYQEMKAFVRDFVDCYEEKMAEIETAENKWKDLLRARANRIVSRRQTDVKDQSLECSSASGAKKIADSGHEERLRAREARRESKKKIREKKYKIQIHLSRSDAVVPLYEGLSSEDDDEDGESFKQERKKLVDELNAAISEEINENFYEYELIKARFEKWNTQFNETYRNAYISLSLPKLFGPLVRCELIDWNPLEKGVMVSEVDNLENTKWFKELLTYNRDEILKSLNNPAQSNLVCEDDFLIIPHIIEKTVLVKLIDIAECFYDPLSTSQTLKFTKLMTKLINSYSTINYRSTNTKMLFDALVARLKKCIDNDVYIPLYPKAVIDLKTSEASIFFHKQFWSCVKLFTNTLKWKGILSDELIKEYALDSLLNRYLMIGLQSMEANMKTLEKIDYIIGSLPAEWLDNTTGLPQLVNIGRIIRRIADNINQKEFEAKLIDKKTFRDCLNQIKKSLVRIGANEQAMNIMHVYDV